ncbi:hypothetical protein SAMN04488004_1283 [Loktanella salsilacus]|uniref:Uncharacterized protein n=1 Tax=Loktanella salsilacus TaxID=195913 RepID=A0A1I4INF4_9RHOB|nr:hypothetical protein [Loktanella salsilacus]SFL55824.1 hypothetical protein SAMN04488004_1283 [Loktanella salsilacus]
MKTHAEPLKVGWIVDAPFGDFAFSEPSSLFRTRDKAASERAVQACPAVNDLEQRLFVVAAPFSFSLSVTKVGEDFDLYVESENTRADADLLTRYLSFMPQNLWRSPDRPVLQVLLPYVFICDEMCYLTQTPPYLDSVFNDWPGTIIAGRFPITNWPRILNWAFEWHDIARPITIKRGQPLCYFSFEGTDPSRRVKLIEAKATDELRAFRKGIEGMPKFTSGTFKVMDEASKRRPKTLLLEADRG